MNFQAELKAVKELAKAKEAKGFKSYLDYYNQIFAAFTGNNLAEVRELYLTLPKAKKMEFAMYCKMQGKPEVAAYTKTLGQ